MRKMALILLTLNTCFLYSQYDDTPAKVYLKSGEVLTGEVNLKTYTIREVSPKKELITFKKGKQKQKIEAAALDSIVFTVTQEKRVNKKKVTHTEQQTFVPVYLKEKKKHLRMARLMEYGRFNIYTRSISSMGMHGSGGFASYNHNQYFVVRPNEDVPTGLLPNGPKKFRKLASSYFSDCAELAEKISSKVYKRENITDILKFYDTNCNK